MMQMLSPDLLDRRAIALIELVDYAGKPLEATAELVGDGLKFFAKGNGRHALLEAPGFEDYAAAFAAPPPVPAVGSKAISVDILIADPIHMSRRAELALPRSADPANRELPDSLFQPLRIAVHAAIGAPVPATAAAVRVSVVHKTSKKLVGNALVRVKSANGKFTGTGFTDLSGEALVIIPWFPISFTTGAATVEDSLAATVTVVADAQKVELTDAAELAAKRMSGGGAALADPDKIAAQFPAPAGGTAIRLSTRKVATIKLEWTPP